MIDMFRCGELPWKGVSLDVALENYGASFGAFLKKRSVHPINIAFTRSRLKAEDFNKQPEMASIFKGVHNKLICMWLAEFTSNLKPATGHAKFRATAFWALADWCHVVYHSELRLRPREIRRAQYAGRLFLQCYVVLSNKTLDRGWVLYNLIPKLHYFDHMVDNVSDCMNPSWLQTDQDETYLATLKHIGMACHGKNTCERLLERWLICTAVRFECRRREGRMSADLL